MPEATISNDAAREQRRLAIAAECDVTLAAITKGWANNPPQTTRLHRPAPAIAVIYFIGPVAGPIKIGFATRLDVRLNDLQLANAYPLQVLASVQGPPRLEREYHKRFAAYRLHGEWFSPAPEILAEITRLRTAGEGAGS